MAQKAPSRRSLSDSVLLPRPQGSGLHEQQDRQQLSVLNGGRAAQQLPVVCRVPGADRAHGGSYFGLSDRLTTDGVFGDWAVTCSLCSWR